MSPCQGLNAQLESVCKGLENMDISAVNKVETNCVGKKIQEGWKPDLEENWNTNDENKNMVEVEIKKGPKGEKRDDGTVPLYRYHHEKKDRYFCTTDWYELEDGKKGWKFDKVLGRIYKKPTTGTIPLYRFILWNGEYFYTTYITICLPNFDRIEGYIFGHPRTGTIPLYRNDHMAKFFCPFKPPHYFYKVDLDENSKRFKPNRSLVCVAGYIVPENK